MHFRVEYSTAINTRVAWVNRTVQKRIFLYDFISIKFKNKEASLRTKLVEVMEF